MASADLEAQTAPKWRFGAHLGASVLPPLGGTRVIPPPFGFDFLDGFTAADGTGWTYALSLERIAPERTVGMRMDMMFLSRWLGTSLADTDGATVGRAISERMLYAGSGVLLTSPRRSGVAAYAVGGGGVYAHGLAWNGSSFPPDGNYSWQVNSGFAARAAAGFEIGNAKRAFRAEIGYIRPIVGQGQPMMPITIGWRF